MLPSRTQGDVIRSPRKARQYEMAMADLDPWSNTEDIMELQGEVKPLNLGKQDGWTINMDNNMSLEQEQAVARVLKANNDLFVWTTTNMSGIYPGVMSHKLAFFKEVWLVA